MKSKIILIITLFLLINIAYFALSLDKSIERNISDSSDGNSSNNSGRVRVIIKLKDAPVERQVSGTENYDSFLSERKAMIRRQQDKFIENVNPNPKKRGVLSAQKEQTKIKHRMSALNMITAEVSPEQVSELESNPLVERVFPDGERQVMLDDSVPRINATLAWGLVYNNTNITGKYETVCVIDTGVDYTHPNLGNCSASDFQSGICKNLLGGYDYVNSDNDPYDGQGHGSHVIGTIISNHSTYKGIAPDAGIVALKACNDASTSSCTISDVASSIDWCINNRTRFNISVISMSLGGGNYDANCDDQGADISSANSAANLGIFVAIAAGNSASSSTISAPACASNVTAVGASTDSDGIASFSNRAPFMVIFAPGVGITSTVPNSGPLGQSSRFSSLQGTSMATPHVSGAVALLRQYKRLEQGKNLTFQQVEDALNLTGISITEGSTIYRRINIYRAILSLDNTSPQINFVSPTKANNSNTSRSYAFINISLGESLHTAILEFNGTNTTMSGSSTNWFYNKTGLVEGSYSYRVFGNDSAGNFGISETRILNQVNNTAPNITSISPNSSSVNITEPKNQTFSISYIDREQDDVSANWYRNGTLVSETVNYTFHGNFTSFGTYNITAILSDGLAISRNEWILNIVNNNSVQYQILRINSSDSLNRTNGTLTAYWSYSDENFVAITANETAWFNNTILFEPSINTTILSAGNTTKNQNWTFSVRVFDGISWSVWSNSSITIKNSAPDLQPISNIETNESLWLNLTLNASDIDGDSINFTTNISYFSIAGNNLSWLTNTSQAGVYSVRIFANDSDSGISYQDFTITINEMIDSDSDGIPDFYDSDDDNDGISDDNDNLLGNISAITTSSGLSINLTINNMQNLSANFSGAMLINLTNGTKPIIEFNWTFNSTRKLNLYNITINIQTDNSTGYIEVRGLNLFGETKTVYIDKLNSSYSSVCVKDTSNASVNNISARCNAQDETVVPCTGAVTSGYTCSLVVNRYRITGLQHTALIERCRDSDGDGYGTGCAIGSDCDDGDASKNTDCSSSTTSSASSSGGGGGGGGGTASQNTASYFVNAITANEPAVISVKKQFFPIKKVAITANKQIAKATLNIRLITNLSEDVPSPAEDYYQYIEITPVGITDSDITSVQFEFSVNKSWLANGNYDEKTVKLNRYLGNSFYELQTDLISDKGKEISYKAISTGFSYYIITAEEKSVQTIEPDIGSSSEITSSQTNASSGDLAGMAIKWADNQETSEQSEMQSPENTNPIETLKSGISKYRVYLIIVAGIVVVILITQFIKITMVRKDLKKPVKKRNAKHRQKNQEADNLPVDNEQK